MHLDEIIPLGESHKTCQEHISHPTANLKEQKLHNENKTHFSIIKNLHCNIFDNNWEYPHSYFQSYKWYNK